MKKIISFILTLIMLASCLSMLCFANDITGPDNVNVIGIINIDTYSVGDADDNGEVNALDSYAIKYSIAFGEAVPNADSADINADGKVTSADAYVLKSCLAGVKDLDDYKSDYALGNFSIGGVDITRFEAVVPEGMTYNDNKYLGYEYLSKFIKVATGFDLPLTYGTESTTGHGIYFNTVDFFSEEGEKYNVDGYSYKVENGNLYIYGTLRGNGYAVFDILENWLGFYFCRDDVAYQYTNRTVDIPDNYEKSYTPHFFMRSVNGSSSWNTKCYERIRGMNSMVTESSWFNNAYCGYITGDAIGTVHSFDEFRAIMRGKLPSDEDTTTNYYYKKDDGLNYVNFDEQVCACDDEAYDEIFAGGLMWVQHISAAPGKYFGTEYGITYMSFGPSDNQNFCKCKLCRNIMSGTSTGRISQKNYDWLCENYCGEFTAELEKSGTTYTISFKKEYANGLYLNMVNRAARDIQDYYPGLKVLTYFYPNEVPETVRPEPNVYLWYCGGLDVTCTKHSLAYSGPCKGYADELISTKKQFEAVEGWRRICDETGAELGYWCYFTNYGGEIFEIPDYKVMYETIHKLYEIGLDGIFYESGETANIHPLEGCMKHYLAQEMIWNPDITYEEFRGLMQKYLKAVYGDGAEDIYSYILMTEEATMATDYCYAQWYRVLDVYDQDYMCENYETMRSYLESAREKVSSRRVKDVDYMITSLDLVGLTANYDNWYTNGDTASKAKYCAMYDEFYRNASAVNLGSGYKLPSAISYDKSPAVQIYTNIHQQLRK